MLTFDEATLLTWLSALLWPFLRVLAMLSSMPIFKQSSVPMRVRIGLAALTAFCAQASMPAFPVIVLDTPVAALVTAQQVVIGLCMGFAVRIVFAGVELAGELIGLQMGLNFAGFFDPATGGQATAVSRFYGTCMSWVFIVSGGHLLMIAAVVQSFEVFPVSDAPLAFLALAKAHTWGGEIFKLGLWIAMPLIAMLLFTNLTLGVITRVAPQINVFAIGFPLTLSVGLLGILSTLPMMEGPFQAALTQMLALFQ